MKSFIAIFGLIFLLSIGGCQDETVESETKGGGPDIVEEDGNQVRGVYVDEGDSPRAKACPEIYDPVCGQPPMPECPEGHVCPQVMPQPKTYSNECMMKNAGAELISRGECERDY